MSRNRSHFRTTNQENPSALDEAVRVTGIRVLADRMGLTYQAIRKWQRLERVPAERIADLIAASDYPLSAADIRPDLAAMFVTQDRAA